MWYLVIVVIVIYVLYCNSMYVYRFYRPTCGYCTSTQDEWELFKFRGFQSLVFGRDINLDDCSDEETIMAQRLNITSVPTIITVLPDGSANVYSGDRSADSILEWVKM